MSELRERILRALLLVPLVASHEEGVPVEALAERLGVSPDALAREIDALLMVGRPPFSPADFLDITVEDGRVFARLPLSLSRPPRLTHDEALALAIGAQAVSSGAGPELAGALEAVIARLQGAMTEAERERFLALKDRVQAGPGPSSEAGSIHDRVRGAVQARQPLRIDYYSASRDARAERRVHPYALLAHEGYWYLVADDAPHGGEGSEAPRRPKLFRLDRIHGAEPAGPPGAFEVPEDLDLSRLRAGRFFEAAGEAVARVRIEAPKARWAVEYLPEADVRWLEDGAAEVRLPLVSWSWVSAWVLSLAPHARVLEPEALAQRVRADAARALAAYDAR